VERNRVNVYLITEGGLGIGLGHVIRCLSLSQAFETKDVKARLIINGDASIKQLIPFGRTMLYNWLENSQMLLDHIRDAEIVVMDSYLAELNLYNSISERMSVTAFFDDYNRLNYPAGIVINGSIGADRIDYPKNNNIKYLLGTDYQMLRKEFWDVPEKVIREEARSVMITFGGEDVRGLTPKIIALLGYKFPELDKYVIVGEGFKQIKSIERLGDERTRLIYYPRAMEMAKVMLDVDFAISSGGQTLYELACIGVPTIAISTTQNQMTNINGWILTKFIAYAGRWDEDDLLGTVNALIKKLFNYPLRQQMKSVGRSMINGKQGALTVADYLLDSIS